MHILLWCTIVQKEENIRSIITIIYTKLSTHYLFNFGNKIFNFKSTKRVLDKRITYIPVIKVS